MNAGPLFINYVQFTSEFMSEIPRVRFHTGIFTPTDLVVLSVSCHKRQKAQAPTPQAPIRNRQTRKVANAKGLNRNTNLT